MTDVLAVVAEQRVLPVVTVESRETAGQLGQALAGAGARAVEITFRSEAAADAIEALAGEGFVVGAGTVRSVEQVDVAIAAGASFVVSPGLDRVVVERCAAAGFRPCRNRDRLGADRGTVARGVDGEALPGRGGRRHRPDRALAAPFPEARFVPTGGLNAGNARDYLALPQVVAIGGSWMVAPPLLTAGNWAEVERLTAEALALGRTP